MSRIKLLFFIAPIALLIASLMHLSKGSVNLSLSDLYDALFHPQENNVTHLIVNEIRIPRLMAALLAGASLAMSGMLLQSIFNNPLAGPYILGINSGASLMVAVFLLSGVFVPFLNLGIIGAAMLGAFIASIIMIFLSGILRTQIALILSGIMFGSFTAALISIIQLASSSIQVKQYTLWSMGSLQNLEANVIGTYTLILFIGVALASYTVKYLNVFVIGEKSAKLLGVSVPKTRVLVLLASAILAGTTTAICGPIAFVGMAIPNLVRILLKTQNHHYLLFGNMLIGALFLVLCDLLVIEFSTELPLPLNAITSLIGAPFILFVLLRKIK